MSSYSAAGWFSVGILRLADDDLSRCCHCKRIVPENLELLEIPRALQYRQDEDKEVTHESKTDLPYRLAVQ